MKAIKGCFVMALLFLLVVVAIVTVSSRTSDNRASTAPTSAPPPAGSAATPAPRTAPVPASTMVEPEPPAVPGGSQAEPASPSPQIDVPVRFAAAKADVDASRIKLETLRAELANSMRASPKFQAVAKDAADLERRVKAARTNRDQSLQAISQQWLAAKAKLTKAERDLQAAVLADPRYVAAEKALAAKVDALTEVENLFARENAATAMKRATTELAARQKRDAERRAVVEKMFSPWDGSHRRLEEFVKESMHNPKSYEHVETKYVDNGEFLIVTTKFRGTNAFGGVATNWVKAKCDLEGNVVSVISRGP